MRISDWSSDVCSSDLARALLGDLLQQVLDDLDFMIVGRRVDPLVALFQLIALVDQQRHVAAVVDHQFRAGQRAVGKGEGHRVERQVPVLLKRSEEHTSELQSLMRISYAVFCLKKKKTENIK